MLTLKLNFVSEVYIGLVGFVIPLESYVYFSTINYSSSKFNEEYKNHRATV